MADIQSLRFDAQDSGSFINPEDLAMYAETIIWAVIVKVSESEPYRTTA